MADALTSMPAVSSVGGLVRAATATLRAAGLSTPDLDARLLTAHAAGLDAAVVHSRSEVAVPAGVAADLERFLERRIAGAPVHRIIGHRPFYEHDFLLSPDTLEPRPDTEILVERARLAVAAVIAEEGTCLFADIGIGSGAIAVSLLALFPQAHAIGVDISEGALEMARINADRAGVSGRLRTVRSDYLAEIHVPLDLLVSNPPYIRSGDFDSLDAGVRDFDPPIALDGGEDGLHAYRAIATGAVTRLKHSGKMFLEIGQGQDIEVAAIFGDEGFVANGRWRDLSGTIRVVEFARRRTAGKPEGPCTDRDLPKGTKR